MMTDDSRVVVVTSAEKWLDSGNTLKGELDGTQVMRGIKDLSLNN